MLGELFVIHHKNGDYLVFVYSLFGLVGSVNICIVLNHDHTYYTYSIYDAYTDYTYGKNPLLRTTLTYHQGDWIWLEVSQSYVSNQ